MLAIKDFFKKIDFEFDKDFYQKDIVIDKNEELTNKLKNNVFEYTLEHKEQTKSTFYIISEATLNCNDFIEIRRYIWNEDKHELFFYSDNTTDISLYYAKNSPNTKPEKLDTFKYIEVDVAKLENIKKWKFENGAFWLSYYEFIDKIKKFERIDISLINQLKTLKSKLTEKLGKDKTDIVQSLIDRMLFIKFLEDNHIINSDFFKHFFNNKDLSYKELLTNKDVNGIKQLYVKLNEIFSNKLFYEPIFNDIYIEQSAELIKKAIAHDNLNDGQLSLFDFRFDIMPIEFISHIYEVFYQGKQLKKGIYYTPPKLAQLIIDDTITKTGKILDPACGSGMFLILAFRKILSKNQLIGETTTAQQIAHKIILLQTYIFGIEKEEAAWRLTIFALYLEIFRSVANKHLIRDFIKERIETKKYLNLFPDFSGNIKNENSLEIEPDKIPFYNQTFDYIIGNPPFLEVPENDDFKTERNFVNKYKIKINDIEYLVSQNVGDMQISQAFILKINDWANPDTRFGFVLNSSNFYKEGSKNINFQKLFFENYSIENFYELSRVKDILFEKAGEPVVVIIFNNKIPENNTLKYYPVDLELFSEQFNLLIIQEDKRIEIPQKDVNKNIKLRDYLVGNEFDLALLNKLTENKKLNDYLLKDKKYSSFEGAKRKSNKEISLHLEKQNIDFTTLNKKEKLTQHYQYAVENYLSANKTENNNVPYIYKPENKLNAFVIKEIDGYVNFESLTKEHFQRPRNLFIFQNEKIIFNRFGERIEACFCKNDIVFSNLIYGIKLNNSEYYLFTALFNSDLINYFLTYKFRKRIDGNFANLDTKAIKNIPIPKELAEELVAEISEISKQLTEEKLQYEGKTKEKLNELIYNLYDLDFLERQRIKDFFTEKKSLTNSDKDIYKNALYQTLEMYFDVKPEIEIYDDNKFGFNLAVTAIFFNGSKNEMPSGKNLLLFTIEQILKNGENFLAMREKIIGRNCIYLIKGKEYKNWTITKACEDGKSILKMLD